MLGVRYFAPLPDLEFARLVAMWYGAHGGSSLRPSSPAISPEISSTNASYPSVPAVSPSAEPGPSMSTAAIQTMLPQFGQIERRAVGPHGASRIKMEGGEKASLRNMRFLLAQHPVGVRVLQAAREAAVDDTRTPNPNPNANANPNPNPSPSPSPSPNQVGRALRARPWRAPNDQWHPGDPHLALQPQPQP